MRIERIRPRRPEAARIREAVRLLRRGELIVFPTETVYGLGADALNPAAVKKIFRAKGRPKRKALIVLIQGAGDLRRIAREIPPLAPTLMKRFWPGPLTLVFKKRRGILPPRVGGDGTVAVRSSPHPIARALLKMLKRPMAAPSANRSGYPSHRTIPPVLRELGRRPEIALFLDGGKTPIGVPSTILDLTKNPPVILRAGPITKRMLAPFLRAKRARA